jgi:hypothetical protein
MTLPRPKRSANRPESTAAVTYPAATTASTTDET